MKSSIIPIVSILTLASLESLFFTNIKNREATSNVSNSNEHCIYFEKSNPNIPNEYLEKINFIIDNCPSEKTIMIKSYCALENNDKCKKALAQQRISRVIKLINQRNPAIKTNQRIFLEGGSIQIRQGQINTEKINLSYK